MHAYDILIYTLVRRMHVSHIMCNNGISLSHHSSLNEMAVYRPLIFKLYMTVHMYTTGRKIIFIRTGNM